MTHPEIIHAASDAIQRLQDTERVLQPLHESGGVGFAFHAHVASVRLHLREARAQIGQAMCALTAEGKTITGTPPAKSETTPLSNS